MVPVDVVRGCFEVADCALELLLEAISVEAAAVVFVHLGGVAPFVIPSDW